jgi:hypothetical protein
MKQYKVVAEGRGIVFTRYYRWWLTAWFSARWWCDIETKGYGAAMIYRRVETPGPSLGLGQGERKW